MKIKYITLLFLTFCATYINAQENISFYNLRDYVVQGQNYSSIITPKHNVTVSLPLNVGIGVNTFISANQLLDKDASTGDLMFNTAKLYQSTDDKNTIAYNLNVNLFNLTVATKKGGFSLFVNAKHNSHIQLSKTLIGITNTGIDSSISLENEKALSTAYTEFGVGYSHSLLEDKLHLGFRAKYLNGHAHAETDKNGYINLDLDPQFKTWQFSAQNAQLRTSGLAVINGDSDFEPMSDNTGFALDFSARYALNEKFTFDLSVNDIGSITWESDLKGYQIEDIAKDQGVFEGIDLNNDESDFGEELESIFVTSEGEISSFSTDLTTQTYFSTNYFLNDRHRLSFIYNNFKVFDDPINTYALGYNLIGSKGTIGVVSSYGGYNNEFKLGMNMVYSIGFWQMYFSTDSLLSIMQPVEEINNVNFNFGINFVFGARDLKKKVETEIIEELEIIPTELGL
jgi:hypothetical protein